MHPVFIFILFFFFIVGPIDRFQEIQGAYNSPNLAWNINYSCSGLGIQFIWWSPGDPSGIFDVWRYLNGFIHRTVLRGQIKELLDFLLSFQVIPSVKWSEIGQKISTLLSQSLLLLFTAIIIILAMF